MIPSDGEWFDLDRERFLKNYLFPQNCICFLCTSSYLTPTLTHDSAMTDLEARFEAVVARLAAMQDAAKVQQAALSSLPTRVDSLQHDLRKQNNKLSSRIDEDLTSLGQEIAMVKVCWKLDSPFA